MKDRQKDFFLNLYLAPDTLDIYYIRKSILNAIKENLPRFNGVLLDLGCGDMPYKQLIFSSQTKVSKYIGIDIEAGKSKYDIQPDYYWNGVNIPLPDNSVDCVIATEVFEHCPDLAEVLKDVQRVLRPGGFVFFTVPFLWPLHEAPYDEFRYTPYALERIFKKSGFSKLELKPTGGWSQSMGQMLGLWVVRSPMNFHLRRVVKILAQPLVWLLIRERKKKPAFGDMTMITGITGVGYTDKAAE